MATGRPQDGEGRKPGTGLDGWVKGTRHQAPAEVEWAIPGNALVNAVTATLEAGHAILIGRARKGNAVGVSVYVGDKCRKEWFDNPIELAEFLEDVADQMLGEANRGSQGSSKPK
jgi:hypothetical protein